MVPTRETLWRQDSCFKSILKIVSLFTSEMVSQKIMNKAVIEISQKDYTTKYIKLYKI